MKTLFFILFLFTASISLAEDYAEWLHQCFPGSEIIAQPLSGGLSGTAMYKVNVEDVSYVLRIHKSPTLSLQDQREHFALVKASKRKISPEIIAMSQNAILMEFVEGKTLTLEQAKDPDILQKIATTFMLAHEMPGHEFKGESLLSKAKRCTKVVFKHGIGAKEDIQLALNLIKNYRKELKNFAFNEVNVHGDLNPRNIFYADGKVLLIDWAESNQEDPFYDLTYFSLKHDLNSKEDFQLLSAYLKKAPSECELSRFQLYKKIHQAFWSLTNLYLAHAELVKHPEQKIIKNATLKNWGYYQKLYAEPQDLPAQYFYELSRLNLQLAQ